MRGYETNGYHRQVEDEYEDEYYDQDEYMEEGSDAEAEEVEEEPPEGQQEFLSLREQLKERIRRQMKMQGNSAGTSMAGRSSSSQDNSRRPLVVKDKFGSFFGPSQPVIASRVIEERRSIKETQNIVSRDPRPSGKGVPSSSKIQTKANEHHRKPKIVNEVKRKVETLKGNRDYSFLLSDDADIPSSTKEQPEARSVLTPKSDRELVQAPGKSKVSTSQPARPSSNGHGLKNPPSTQRHVQNQVGSMKKETFPNKERAVSLDNKRMLGGVRNGSSQPTANKTPNKNLVADKPLAKAVNDPSVRKHNVALKPHSSSQGQRPQAAQSQKLHPSQSQRPQSSSHSQRLQLSSQSHRLQSSQSQRPQSSQSQRPQSSQSHRPHSSQSQKPQSSQSHRPQSSPSHRLHSSLQGHHSEQKRLVQAHDRVKPVQKQLGPSSKPKPSRPISSNGVRDDHAKKKHIGKRRFDDDFDDEDDPLAMIRHMFGYDPRKFAGRDEDDSDMEADFDTIQREELRSSKIAREEDEEQLRLIEEEERRERMRKKQKMQRQR